MSNETKQTALDELIKQINDEINILDSLHGSEIFGRKVGLFFAERVALSLKQMEEEQIKSSWNHGFDWGMMEQSLAEQGEQSTLIDANYYYNETYGGNK